MWWIFRVGKLARRVWQARRQPRPVALAVALGVAFGLLPKNNLTACLMGLVVFSIRCHLPTLALTAMASAFVGPVLDPITGAVGERLLTHPRLVPLWWKLHEWPLVPWLKWNNTVVLGSLVVGSSAAPLVYAATYRLLAARWLTAAEQTDEASGEQMDEAFGEQPDESSAEQAAAPQLPGQRIDHAVEPSREPQPENVPAVSAPVMMRLPELGARVAVGRRDAGQTGMSREAR